MAHLEYMFRDPSERYPGKTLEVDVCRPPWDDMDGKFKDLVCSITRAETFELLLSPGKARLTFTTTADADRAMAIMNEHPTMKDIPVSFCRAPETMYPPIATLFTTRIIEPYPGTRIKGGDDERDTPPSWVCACPHWAREYASGAPTPEQVYDAVAELGPVHHVEVIAGIDETRHELPWEAKVQFWSPETANKLDDMYPEKSKLLGWEVGIYGLDEDFVTQKTLEKCDAIRAELNLPPLGSDCNFIDPLEEGYAVLDPDEFWPPPIDRLMMQIDKAAYDQGLAPDLDRMPDEAELRRMVDAQRIWSAPKDVLRSVTWRDGARVIRERLQELPFAIHETPPPSQRSLGR